MTGGFVYGESYRKRERRQSVGILLTRWKGRPRQCPQPEEEKLHYENKQLKMENELWDVKAIPGIGCGNKIVARLMVQISRIR